MRAGISSLSLSSANSTHTYRKDLDQQFASLIVNPATMQAELKVALRVPEEAFPSIASVPGAMISFKYYVEVVVDIQGKLASLDKYLPTANTPQGGIINNRPTETSGAGYAPWGGHFINTEDIKRERSVIYSVFEVVVGTRDSERRSPWKQPQTDSAAMIGPEITQSNGFHAEALPAPNGANGGYATGELVAQRPVSWEQYWRDHPPDQAGEEAPPQVPYTPPPPIEDEQHLSEKERLQRAEARLLPSAPPDAGESSSTVGAQAPSAPRLGDERPLPPLPSAPPDFDFEFDGPSASSVHTVTQSTEPEGSAPAYEHGQSSSLAVTDDKEEARHQRLLSERSAPPPAEQNEQLSHGVSSSEPPAPSAPSVSSTQPSAPSADLFHEEEHFGFSAPSSHHQLPRYER
jgi:hypothetical protein